MRTALTLNAVHACTTIDTLEELARNNKETSRRASYVGSYADLHASPIIKSFVRKVPLEDSEKERETKWKNMAKSPSGVIPMEIPAADGMVFV
jgi:hypothetical protein